MVKRLNFSEKQGYKPVNEENRSAYEVINGVKNKKAERNKACAVQYKFFTVGFIKKGF